MGAWLLFVLENLDDGPMVSSRASSSASSTAARGYVNLAQSPITNENLAQHVQAVPTPSNRGPRRSYKIAPDLSPRHTTPRPQVATASWASFGKVTSTLNLQNKKLRR